MGQCISRRHAHQYESRREESALSTSIRKINYQRFQKYMKNGDVANVKLAITGGNCDVNMDIYHDGVRKRPLLIAIENIQEENVSYFKIAQMLLDCKYVDINAKVIDVNVKIGWLYNLEYTILEYMCKNKQKNNSWC